MSINPVTNPDDLYGLMAPDALLKHARSIFEIYLPRAGIAATTTDRLCLEAKEEQVTEFNSVHNKPAFDKAHAALTDIA